MFLGDGYQFMQGTSIIWMTRAPFFPCLDHGTDGSPNMVQDWSLVLYTGYIRVYIYIHHLYPMYVCSIATHKEKRKEKNLTFQKRQSMTCLALFWLVL